MFCLCLVICGRFNNASMSSATHFGFPPFFGIQTTLLHAGDQNLQMALGSALYLNLMCLLNQYFVSLLLLVMVMFLVEFGFPLCLYCKTLNPLSSPSHAHVTNMFSTFSCNQVISTFSYNQINVADNLHCDN